MSVAEVVVDDDLMTLVEQELGNCAADVTGSAGNEYSQNLSPAVDRCIDGALVDPFITEGAQGNTLASSGNRREGKIVEQNLAVRRVTGVKVKKNLLNDPQAEVRVTQF